MAPHRFAGSWPLVPPSANDPSSDADSEPSDIEQRIMEPSHNRPPFGRLSRAWGRSFLGFDPSHQHLRDDSLGPTESRRQRWTRVPRLSRRPRLFKLAIYLFTGYLLLLGMLQLLEDIPRYLERIYPDEIQWVVDHWGQPHELTESLSHWPTDASRDAKPISCHSHNDYWRDVPLYSALNAGCTSVEADVWLFNNNFYVGHTTSSLTAERTLRSLYLEPLLDLIQKQNPTTPFRQDREALQGIFDTEASQPIVLLIDFKTPGAEIWPELLAQLSPLRERNYLTYFNGTAIIQRPITIVASGNAPFDLIIANTTYRDVFFDAPLSQIGDFSSQWPNPNLLPDAEKLANNALLFNPDVPGLRPADPSEGEAGDVVTPEALESYHVNNSHYASTSFTKSVGYIWGSRLSQQQLQILRSQIRGAHERGLKARYWGLPYWPIGLRNHVWHILMREGADVLSVDDLFGATRRDWRRSKGLSF